MCSYPAQIQSEEIFDGARIGHIVHMDDQGVMQVDFNGNPGGPQAAKITGTMRDQLESRGWTAFDQVLLVFEENDPTRPVIIDIIVGAVNPTASREEVSFQLEENNDVTLDGKTIAFNASERIVLKCGKASITLTKAGKILIRGAYLLNRSSGVNRIRGASVHVN